MHRPERWGFVQFTTEPPGSGVAFRPDPVVAGARGADAGLSRPGRFPQGARPLGAGTRRIGATAGCLRTGSCTRADLAGGDARRLRASVDCAGPVSLRGAGASGRTRGYGPIPSDPGWWMIAILGSLDTLQRGPKLQELVDHLCSCDEPGFRFRDRSNLPASPGLPCTSRILPDALLCRPRMSPTLEPDSRAYNERDTGRRGAGRIKPVGRRPSTPASLVRLISDSGPTFN